MITRKTTSRTPLWVHVAVAICLALMGAAIWFWPHLQARRAFAAIDAGTQRAALISAGGRHGTLAAFDAAGAEVSIRADAVTGSAPGPCLSSYGRWRNPALGGHSRSGSLFGISGSATFTCLHDLTVEGHGTLRTVVRVMLLTDPPGNWRPEGEGLRGAAAREALTRLEALR